QLGPEVALGLRSAVRDVRDLAVRDEVGDPESLQGHAIGLPCTPSAHRGDEPSVVLDEVALGPKRQRPEIHLAGRPGRFLDLLKDPKRFALVSDCLSCHAEVWQAAEARADRPPRSRSRCWSSAPEPSQERAGSRGPPSRPRTWQPCPPPRSTSDTFPTLESRGSVRPT